MACCTECASGAKQCAGNVGSRNILDFSLGMILPCIRGPFGIMPIRLRCRITMAASKDDQVLATANAVLGTKAKSGADLPTPSVLQATLILAQSLANWVSA